MSGGSSYDMLLYTKAQSLHIRSSFAILSTVMLHISRSAALVTPRESGRLSLCVSSSPFVCPRKSFFAWPSPRPFLPSLRSQLFLSSLPAFASSMFSSASPGPPAPSEVHTDPPEGSPAATRPPDAPGAQSPHASAASAADVRTKASPSPEKDSQKPEEHSGSRRRSSSSVVAALQGLRSSSGSSRPEDAGSSAPASSMLAFVSTAPQEIVVETGNDVDDMRTEEEGQKQQQVPRVRFDAELESRLRKVVEADCPDECLVITVDEETCTIQKGQIRV
ncbi:hypothetical protein CSUI_006893 [Cystoisospora suis]|uniref:Uncharacterized protein n=1 Tax=Cystoisospora suis TaxID=483139 RepID=A0A2C6KFK7_9APIC|nr:hypothetical protein CSUI_006893 [Cystoisospora suis]